MDNITLYTTNCPKCQILKEKLDAKNVQYSICEDTQKMLSLGFKSAPMLQINEETLTFSEAVKWINNLSIPQ